MKVESILKEYGPMLSGKLAKLYEERYEVSNVTARKALSRAKSPVQKLCSISFDNNQKFFYLEQQFMREKYKHALVDLMSKHSKAYYSVITALEGNAGFANIAYLPAYTRLTVENLKGHRRYDRVIKDLEDANIICKFTDDTYTLSHYFFPESNYNYYKAIEIAKRTIIDDFYEWARKINLIAYNSGKTFFQTPVFSKFQWCFTSPSYVTGIKNSDIGMLVADVFAGRSMNKIDAEIFLEKMNTVKSLKNHINFVPVIIAETINEEAFNMLKQNGVLIMTINNLFSIQYLKALKDLVAIITNAAAIISKNPEHFLEYLDSVSKLEGKFSNIRGEMFELAVAHHFSLISRYFEVNKLIRNVNNGKINEIDLYVQNDNQITIIECKGYKHKLDIDFVKKWLSETIPNIRRYFLDKEPEKIISFELWSTGGFEAEAEKILKKQSEMTKKYSITFFDRNDIIALARKHSNNILEKIIDKYY